MSASPKQAEATPGKKRGRKSEGKKDGETTPKKKKALDSRFGGRTEEEIMQLLLPDHLQKDLEIVFIGINPGLLSAHLGHHYCNANNHFWPCMYESGLIPRKLTYREDAECLQYGIGFTNIVPRTTRSSNDLTRKEIKEWSSVMIERMKELRPLVACFNGKGIYEIFTGKKCEVGVQTETLPDTDIVVYVMPSTSGRAASHPRRVDKLKFFYELKELRDRLKLQCGKTSTKDATYSQLGTANEQLSDSGHVSKSQPASVLVASSTKDQSHSTDPSSSMSNSTRSAPTVSATTQKEAVVTSTTNIPLLVASTAVTAHPGVVATPPVYSAASTSMPVSTGGVQHPQAIKYYMPYQLSMPGSQMVLMPQLSQGLQLASTSAFSSQSSAPVTSSSLELCAGGSHHSSGNSTSDSINPPPLSQGP